MMRKLFSGPLEKFEMKKTFINYVYCFSHQFEIVSQRNSWNITKKDERVREKGIDKLST